jgi:hypothetical protein
MSGADAQLPPKRVRGDLSAMFIPVMRVRLSRPPKETVVNHARLSCPSNGAPLGFVSSPDGPSIVCSI